MKTWLNIVTLLLTALTASATNYWLSPTGSDSHDGTTHQTAFATIGRAQRAVRAGDNVYIVPGTYRIAEDQISKTDGIYKIVFNLNQKGTEQQPISFVGLTENGRRPVFDLSQVNPKGYRVTAFYVTGQHLVFRNFEVVGIMVNITGHTQSENFRIRNGCYNTFDHIACHDGMGIGFYLTNNAHHNVFVNCDGYNQYDPVSEDGKGGQNDGFGCHVQAGNEGNIFIGCRAWNNSDDGFDLINCYSPVTLRDCVACRNGFDAEGNRRQDGNGFKVGGYGMSARDVVLPAGGAPRHVVEHCTAAQNKANGFYANHHLGGIDIRRCTAVDNGAYNYNMVNRKGPSAQENVDVDGYGHVMEDNVSLHSRGKHVGWCDGAGVWWYENNQSFNNITKTNNK